MTLVNCPVFADLGTVQSKPITSKPITVPTQDGATKAGGKKVPRGYPAHMAVLIEKAVSPKNPVKRVTAHNPRADQCTEIKDFDVNVRDNPIL